VKRFAAGAFLTSTTAKARRQWREKMPALRAQSAGFFMPERSLSAVTFL
jgi:hypothetical protein